MNKPVTPTTKARNNADSLPNRNPRKKSPKKQVATISPQNFRQKFLFLTIETLFLAIIVTYGIVVVLGNAANGFSGTSFLGNLLPFAAGVMALIVASTLFLVVWWKLRRYLNNHSAVLIPITAIILVLVIALISGQDMLNQSIGQFRTLVGGKEEASRVTLNHQVFAAYRRYNSINLNKMMQRSEPYNAAIAEAATEFDIDQNLLQGIAATESSFMPRESRDGGHGLFQITAIPKSVLEEAKEHLKTDQLSLSDHRHNAFIAAVTLKHYLAEMKNDMFLGLLAYNIGPANGGLRFIMKKYGVTDFITIQPYLQLLPRDYPIRVLSYALAFRLWQKQGKLLAYEQGNNAMQIQRLGVPGLP
ncbi:transglycosylase SLT domain-containing protein [Methyloglobulus sp.]|uniref:transglycosylase SLT domain-containing protein n=1 Tax=Methyloglobulus sp. TaxID=2518622 RepID=UPI0032B81B5B